MQTRDAIEGFGCQVFSEAAPVAFEEFIGEEPVSVTGYFYLLMRRKLHLLRQLLLYSPFK